MLIFITEVLCWKAFETSFWHSRIAPSTPRRRRHRFF